MGWYHSLILLLIFILNYIFLKYQPIITVPYLFSIISTLVFFLLYIISFLPFFALNIRFPSCAFSVSLSFFLCLYLPLSFFPPIFSLKIPYSVFSFVFINSFLPSIIIIIIISFFTSANADGFSQEFEWQQVFSSIQDSSQYSDRSQ